jgi:uncharacterized protein
MTAEAAERQEQWPRWPLWAPLAAIFFGFGATILIMSVVAGVLRASGVHVDANSPGFTVGFTFAQDICIAAACVGLAAVTLRPRAEQFGLRRAPLRYTAGIAFIGVATFYLFSVLYSVIFQPNNPQRTIDDLGADKNTALLVAGAVLVILVAPVCEEIVFRGFIYRVLRSRMAFWLAAGIDGILFGLVHGVNAALPVLAFLGAVLCWVFERTGTLFAPIAIHALNNAISYGATTNHGWPAALPIGAAVLAGCVLVPRALPRGPAPAPA